MLARRGRSGDLLAEIASSGLQILKRIEHEAGLHILAYYIRSDKRYKKGK